MTNTNNLKLIENKKLVETVYELKDEYKIPSFEEFMKTYEDDNLNYDDLNSADIGVSKGYGPIFGDGDPGFRESMEKTRKEIERRRKENPKPEDSKGEKITKGLVAGFAAAALGPIGAIAVGTGLLVIGNNLGDDISDIGSDMITNGVSDGIVNGAKNAVVKK